MEDQILQTLQEISALLGKYSTAHQRIIDELIQLRERNDPAFAKKMQSGSVWGGSGSVVDVWFYPSNDAAISEKEAVSDNRTRNRLFLSLITELETEGLATREIRWSKDRFKGDLYDWEPKLRQE